MRTMWLATLMVMSACGDPAGPVDGGSAMGGGAATAGGSAMGGGTATAGGSVTGGGVAMGGGSAVDAGALPRIDSITPQQVRAGEQVAVLGAGLEGSGVQELRVDGAIVPRAALKPGSSDRLLLLDVPPLLGLPDAGRLVTLSVTTGMGMAQGTFTALPGESALLQTASSLTPRTLTPGGSIQANTEYTLTVDVQLSASRAETFELSAAVEGAGFSIVDVVPGTIAVLAASTPVVTPVAITVRAGASGVGQVGLKVRPRSVLRDGSVLVPRVALEVGAAAPVFGGVLFGDFFVFGPHGVDVSSFVPVVRALSASAATTPTVRLSLAVGSASDGGVLSVTNLSAPAGWNPVTTMPASGGPGGSLAPMTVSFSPTVADGGFAVGNGEFSFSVEDSASGASRVFRGLVQVVR